MVGDSRLLTFKRIALTIAMLIVAAAVAGKLASAASSEGPSASFTFDPVAPLSGDQISFSSTSTDDGSLAQLEWDFDDGDTASGASVNHTYAIPGTYTVSLTVTDDEGLSSSAQDTITVANRDPSADFHWSPSSPVAGDTVSFTSDASDPEGRILAERWDLDGDGQFDDDEGSTASRALGAGRHTVSLEVEDRDGATAAITKTVDVVDPPNRAPSAGFDFTPGDPKVLEPITFTSTSSDSDGAIASLEWDLNNDGNFDDATGAQAQWSFPLAGTYTVRLLATDNEGASAAVTRSVTVAAIPNDAPVASFSFAPSSPLTGESVTFTSDSTDDGALAEEEWDLDGDGTYEANGSEVQRTYAVADSYTVRLRVTDEFGVQDTTSKTVTVAEPRNDPPTVAFQFSPSSPKSGEIVTFTSTSSDDGVIASQEWDFGDDGSIDATGAEVQRVFDAPKSYTVRLRVTDDKGVFRETTKTVAVPNLAPTADFTFSPASPQKGQTVDFSSLATDPENRVLGLAWDLDGDTEYDDASGITAQKAFTTSGSHTVGLKITDQDGASDTVSKTLTVANQAPVASFGFAPSTPRSFDVVTFNSTSTDPDGVEDIVDIDWDVDGDGFDDGSGPQKEHTYTTAGTKTVRIRVTDSAGASAIGQQTVPVENLPPAAKLFSYSPSAPERGQPVSFNAGSSTDRDGSITRYDWDFNGDDVWDRTTTGATTSFAFQSIGLFVVRLRVTDDRGATDEIERGITVGGNKPPTAAINSPSTIVTGSAATFTATASDPDGQVTKYEWDFNGDGNYDDGLGSARPWTFLLPGPATVGLRVTDNDGATGFAEKLVTVGNRPPVVVVAPFNATPQRNEIITLDASEAAGTTDPDGSISKWEWDLNGDGDYTDVGVDKLGAIVTHTYTTLGAKKVKVRVTDSSPLTSTNRTATKELALTVVNANPTATFVHNPASPSPDELVELTATAGDVDGGSIAKYEWDLDGNGTIDKTGTPVTTKYTSVGTRNVTLRVTDDDGGQATVTQPIVVGNRPPVAAFDFRPSNPVAGQQVTLFSTSSDPDHNLDHGTATWDLDADGVFETAGRTVTNVFGFAGSYTISLRIQDTEGEPSIATQTVTVGIPAVAPPQAASEPRFRLLNPFPIVRIAGRIGRTGTRFRVLSVSAPSGSTVTVRCKGRGCPFKASKRSAKVSRQVRIRKLERRLLHAGASIRIFVTKPGAIGKYTSIRIRKGKPPRRSDRCLMPEDNTKPVRCPS